MMILLLYFCYHVVVMLLFHFVYCYIIVYVVHVLVMLLRRVYVVGCLHLGRSCCVVLRRKSERIK